MSATILDGRQFAAALRGRLTEEAARFASAHGRRATLVLVGVGHDPTAALYAGQVVRSCLRVGLDCTVRSFAADVPEAALRDTGISLRGQNAVVVGRSNVGGKPAALLFLREQATITICHSRTVDLAAVTRQADVVFTSIGQAGMLRADMIKPGAVVLDAGINTVDGRIQGDVDFAAVREVAGYITPVPGGLGPLTNLMLLRHALLGPT